MNTTRTTSTPAPEGWIPWPHPSPVLDALGTFFQDGTDPCRVGFLVEGSKLNARGFLHAGTILTIADVAIGHGLAAMTDPPGPAVTVHLSADIVGSAREGDWVDLVVSPTKVGRRLCAGQARLTTGHADQERVVATVTALFVPV